MAKTRKNRRGGAWYNKKGPVPAAAAAETAAKELQRVSTTQAHSNMQSVFSGISKNKAMAKAKYNATMKEIEAREAKETDDKNKPISSLKKFANELKDAITSDTARQTGAVTFTIPVGLAQIILKSLMLVIALVIFIFVEIPSMGSFPISQYFLPDSGFDTTETAYERLRQWFKAPSL